MTTETTAPARLERPGHPTIAYHRLSGKGPGVVFLGGFMSDMTGTKATTLEAHCRATGRAFVRFDYRGHGQSDGRIEDGTIGGWAEDAIAVLDALTEGPQILVGSSLGGWVMLLVALARPDRVAGMLGLAAAPDFTERLIWQELDDDQRNTLMTQGSVTMINPYGGTTPVSRALIEDGRDHLLLHREIPVACPVHLVHGLCDEDVPWRTSLDLMERLYTEDVAVTFVKAGDHRLSRAADLRRLERAVDALVAHVTDAGPGVS